MDNSIMLMIHNSLTQQKEAFKPLNGKKVNMYVCGMTVYDLCHIGHARTVLAFDMVYRYLTFLGYDVHYVRNVTDIDDKIIARAAENNEAIDALTTRFTAKMHEDLGALGALSPTEEPVQQPTFPRCCHSLIRWYKKVLRMWALMAMYFIRAIIS